MQTRRFSSRRRRGAVLGIATLLALLVAAASECPLRAGEDPAVVGQWTQVIPWPIVAIHTNLLPNGKVLAWPRDGGNMAQLWDPAADTFAAVPNQQTNVFCAGHSFLPDGRLLVTGGHVTDGVGLRHTNLFDPGTNTWSRVGDMQQARWYPSNCSLANGEQLVVSGNIDNRTGPSLLPQVWNASQGWRDLTRAKLLVPLYPFLHVALDGKVFCPGPNQLSYFLSTAGAGALTRGPISKFGYRDYGSSMLYDDGKVLMVGGHDPPTATAEVIDLTARTPAWRYVAPMAYARRQLNATLLPDGTVLVTGGTSSRGFNTGTRAVFAAELWDPTTERWSTLASMQVPRLYHSTALLLPDGRVLSGGGGEPAASGDVDHPNVEFFSPPYLFKGDRPEITSAPASVAYGETFLVGTPDAGRIARVTWLRLGSVTHAFNQNQRINRLSFSPAEDGLNVVAPTSARLCPPGHYMLFLLNDNGVPSVARIIQIQSPSGPALEAPYNLRAAAISRTVIAVAWTPPQSGETSVKIERSRDGALWSQVAAVRSLQRSYQDAKLGPNTLYYYRACSSDGSLDSPASAVVSARTFR
jgi:Galactose oxidase-like, Early set domain/Glyoxal oxidase N-terminus